ncbi:WD40 repeat domain-containing protein [Limnoglobus roseus]|uniref:WD40 repeat domain-containing protein n=1 Tax=Limnoglobus roseus TaxID=2598579 RepID=A0A5C1A6C6_9BACT|nr:WD40 repeat domain-containing protein [Limnoglobus roseus]QEL13546.1 WD40 repeat domain-containing protein [Limnoglobus roseus]
MRLLRTLLVLAGLCPFAFAEKPQAVPPAESTTARAESVTSQADPAARPPGAKLRLGSTLFRIDSLSRHTTLLPDGKTIVRFVQPEKLQFISVETGRETRSIKLKEQVQSGYTMSLSPTGERLIITTYNAATVVDVKTGDIIGKMARQNNEGKFARALDTLSDGLVSCSGNGRYLAFGTRYPQKEGEVFAYVFDTEKNDFIADVKVLQRNYINAVLTADGKTFASFGQHYVQNNEEAVAPVVQIWDVAGKKELAKVRTSLTQVMAARFSLDGKTLYTGGQGGPIESWDVATGKKLRQYITRSNVGHKLFLSADGKRLAAASQDGAVQVWEADTGKRLGVSSAQTNSVEMVALPPDGPAVAFGLYSQTMQVWQVPGKVLTPQDGHFGPVNIIQYTPDGKQIVTAGQDGRVVRWDAATGAEVETYGYSPTNAPREITKANLRGLQPARAVRWSNSWSIYAGTFSPDASTIYLQGGQGGVTVVDIATGQEQFTLFFPNARNSHGNSRPSLSADGRRVGAAGQHYDRNKYVFTAAAWDTETGETLAEVRMDFDQNTRYVNGMATAVSPDGAYFGFLCNIQHQQTGQSTTEFTTFDLNTGAKLASGGQSGRSYSPFLQAAPDNRSAVSLDQQNQLLVWDLPTGKLTRTLTSLGTAQQLPPTFHPSGRTFAIATSDATTGTTRHTVRIVEWASGQTRMELPLENPTTSALAYSPDGNTLAVGWHDSTVLLFDVAGDDAKKPWEAKPTEPKQLWASLSGTSAKAAWQAMRELGDRPDVAMNLIRENVKPVPAPAKPSAEQIGTWITALDAPAFAAREAALKDLKRLGKAAEKELKAALETTPSPETKERVEKLLTFIIKPVTPNVPEARAVELLERIGNAEARGELSKLAAGDPASLMTQDAAKSLQRLANKR